MLYNIALLLKQNGRILYEAEVAELVDLPAQAGAHEDVLGIRYKESKV